MLSTLLAVITFVGLGATLLRAEIQKVELRKRLRKYDALTSKEAFTQQLESGIHRKENEIDELAKEEEKLLVRIRSLQAKLSKLEEESYLESLGFYEPKYDFIRSEDYERRFDQIKAERKRMVKNETAAICRKKWLVGEDAKKGEKMIKDYLKVIRGAFDTICDSAVNEAKFSNINKLKKRVADSFEKLNKSSITLECKITEEYLNLRLRELDIKYELELKKQEEKERDRAIRDEMAKEKKEREAIEKARQEEEEAAQRERLYQEELEKIRQEMAQAVGNRLEELEAENKRYEQLVAQAQAEQEEASLRFRRLKAGTIYVISNIGSLGQDIHRIFMTLSNEPDRYVRNMNPFVPFPFSIHIKVSSEDALDTLKRLHERFNNKRVNTANPRRDFFEVSLQEIKQAIQEISSETGLLKNIQEFEDIPLENEYVRTLSFKQKYQEN